MISDDCFLNLDLDWLLFIFFSSFSVPTSSSSSSWPRCCSSSTSGSRCRKRRTRPSRRSRHSSGKTTERPVDKIETNGIEKKQLRRKKHLPLTWSFPEKVSIFGLLPQPSLSKVPPPFMLVEKKAKISPNVIPVVWQHGRHR